MNAQLDCKAVIYVTDDQGLKKYYALHFPSPGVCDHKQYASLPALLTDLTTLDPINNLWTGLSNFQMGAPSLGPNEKIYTQIGFKGAYDEGNGTANGVLILVKQQADPKVRLIVLSASASCKQWMQNAGY